MSDDIDITKLETSEILELIQDDLYDGLAEEVKGQGFARAE
jgi:hypothetical protein